MTAKDMIHRYIAEHCCHLPRKLRNDVEIELLSLLDDDLPEKTVPKTLELNPRRRKKKEVAA